MTDQTETPELKPCPFCGYAAIFVKSWLPGTPICSVTCDGDSDCMGQNMEQDEQGGFTCEGSIEYVTGKWNTRADISDAKDKRIDELEAKLAKAARNLKWLDSELKKHGYFAQGKLRSRCRATLADLKGTADDT